ncbi:hypothetical protein Tco_1561326 [Tanacetum coccineum]
MVTTGSHSLLGGKTLWCWRILTFCMSPDYVSGVIKKARAVEDVGGERYEEALLDRYSDHGFTAVSSRVFSLGTPGLDLVPSLEALESNVVIRNHSIVTNECPNEVCVLEISTEMWEDWILLQFVDLRESQQTNGPWNLALEVFWAYWAKTLTISLRRAVPAVHQYAKQFRINALTHTLSFSLKAYTFLIFKDRGLKRCQQTSFDEERGLNCCDQASSRWKKRFLRWFFGSKGIVVSALEGLNFSRELPYSGSLL